MASVGEGDCHKDPNFAVICSCLDKYGESLGLPSVSYLDLKTYLEDTSPEGCRVLIDIHVRLLRRIGKSSVTADRFEKSIIKFCHHFSEFDAWEVESYGYRHAQISTKLRILKNLLECQFDFNVKFKEKVNESSAEDMRMLPIGRDKEGQAYWYFVDKDNNLMVYKEEQDDEAADTWQLICSDRQQLVDLVETLQKNAKTEVKEEEDKSASTSRSSKEGSPDKEIVQTSKEVSSSIENLKKEEPGKTSESPLTPNVIIKLEVADKEPPQDKKDLCAGPVKDTNNQDECSKQHDTALPNSNLQSTSNDENIEIKKEENVCMNSTETSEAQVRSVNKEISKLEAAAEVAQPAKESVSSDDKESPTESIAEMASTDNASNSSQTNLSQKAEDKSKKSPETDISCSDIVGSSEKEFESEQVANKSEQNSNKPDLGSSPSNESCNSSKPSLETKITNETADTDINNTEPASNECLSGVKEFSTPSEILVQSTDHATEDKPIISGGSSQQSQTDNSQKIPVSPSDNVNKATPTEEETKASPHCSSEDTEHAVKDQRTKDTEDDKKVKSVGDSPKSQQEEVSLQSSDIKPGDVTDNEISVSNHKVAENNGAKTSNLDISKLTDSDASDSKGHSVSKPEPVAEQQHDLSVGSENLLSAVQEKDTSSTSPSLSNSVSAPGSEVSKKLTDDTVRIPSEPADVSNNSSNQRLSSSASVTVETVSMSKDPPDKATLQKSESKPGPRELENNEISKECSTKLAGLELEASKNSQQGENVEEEERSECNANDKDTKIKPVEVIKQVVPESQSITLNNLTADGKKEVIESNFVEVKPKCNGLDKMDDITVAESAATPTVNGHVLGEDSCKKINNANTKTTEAVETDNATVSGTKTSNTNNSHTNSAKDSTGLNRPDDAKQDGDAGPGEASGGMKVVDKRPEDKYCEKGDGEKKEIVNSQEEIASKKESAVETRSEVCKPSNGEEPENVAENPSINDSEKENSKTTINDSVGDVDDAERKTIETKTSSSEVCDDRKEKTHEEASESEVIDKDKDDKKADKGVSETEKEMDCCDNLKTSGDKDVTDTKIESINTVTQCKENNLDDKMQEEKLTNADAADTKEGEDIAPVSKEPMETVKPTSNDKVQADGEKSEDKKGKNATENSSVQDSSDKSVKQGLQESNETKVESQELKENSCVLNEDGNMEGGEEEGPQTKLVQGTAEVKNSNTEGVKELEIDKSVKESDVKNIVEKKVTSKEMSGEEGAVTQKKVAQPSCKDNHELNKEASIPKTEEIVDSKLAKASSEATAEVGVNKEASVRDTEKKEMESDKEKKDVGETGAKESMEDKDENINEKKSKETGAKDAIGKADNEEEKSVITKSDSSKQENGEEHDGGAKEESGTKSCEGKQLTEKDVGDKAVSSPATPVSGRKLKRAAPEAGSDDSPGITEQPDGKRARQMARVTRTRGGRNAAARGRAALQATQGGSESEDSEAAPSSRGRGGKRGRGGRGRGRGRGGSKTSRANSKTKSEDAGDDEAGANEKRAKKKKPDSSTEDLSGEEVTPAKKGRNQPQTPSGGTPVSTPRGGRGGKRGRGRGRGRGSAASTPAADNSALRRSTRVRQTKSRKAPTSPSEESSEDTEEETEEDEKDIRAKDFLDASFTPEEESSDEEFKPKGRNFQRQEARTIKEENNGECVNDDTPCLKCGKYNHPEMILLCDKCDAGYHTACLRPPLMLIPDGDWYCPPCEHSSLVTKLMECLQALDVALKKKDRLKLRQERLAYVGINIGNILQAGERKVKPSDKFDVAEEDEENDDPSTKKRKTIKAGGSGEEDEEATEDEEVEDEEATEDSGSAYSSEESEPEMPERKFRSTRLAQRQAQKSSRRREKERHKRRKAGGRRSEGATSPEVIYGKRTCRTRSNVSYQFKEFDELISNAIEDDKPVPKEKKPGRSTGKDMSNILGVSDDEEDEEEDKPGPVVKRKSKRKLTKLDSDESEQDDESEEFKLSEDDSEATEIEEEEEEEEEEVNSEESADSGAWKPKKTWFNSKSVRRPKKSRFVVEDDEYDSDENARKRRSTRNSNRGRVSYNDWGSDDETEEEASFTDYSSEDSRKPRKAVKKSKPPPAKKKAKQAHSEEGSQSDSSINRKRKILRKLVKKRRKDESESDEDETEEEKQPRKRKGGKSDSDFTLEEGESSSGAEDSKRFKKKNVLRSSDEEGGAEGKKAAIKPNEDTNKPEVMTEKAEPVAPEMSNTDEPAKGKGQTAGGNKKSAKGKKRVEAVPEDESAVSAVSGVPGKVRRVSGSDKETGATPLAAAPPSKRRQPARRQRGKSSEASGDKDKAQLVIPDVGKGKNVPNFLGVPEDGNDDQAKAADVEKQQPLKTKPTSNAPVPTDAGETGPLEPQPAALQQQSGNRLPFPGQIGPHQHPGMPPQGTHHPHHQVRQQHPMPQFTQGQRFQGPRMGSPPQYPGAGGVPRQGYYPGLEPGQIPPGQRFQQQSQMGGGMQPSQPSSQHPTGPGIPPHTQHSQGYPRMPGHHPQHPMTGLPPPHTSSQAGEHPHNPAVYAQQQQPPMPHQPFPGTAQRMPAPREMGPGQGYYGMRGPYFGQPYGMIPGQMPPGNMNSPLTRMGQMTRNLGPNTMTEPSPPAVAEKRPSLGSPPHSAEGPVKQELEGAVGRTKQPKLEGDTKGSEKAVTGTTKKQRSKGKKAKQEAASNQNPSQGSNLPQGMPPGVVTNQGVPTASMQRAPAPNPGLPQAPGMMQGQPPHPGMQPVHQPSQGPSSNQGMPQGPPPSQGAQQVPPPTQGMSQGPLSQGMAQRPTANQGMPQGPPSSQTMVQGIPPGQGVPQGSAHNHGIPLGPPSNQSMLQGQPQSQGMPQVPPTSQGMPQGPPPNHNLPHGMISSQGMPQGTLQNQGMPQGPMTHGMPPYQGMHPPHGAMYAGHMPPYGMPPYPHHMPYMPHPHYQQQRPYMPPPPHGPPRGPPQGPVPQISQAPPVPVGLKENVTENANKTVTTCAPTVPSTPVSDSTENECGEKDKDSVPPSMVVTSLSASVVQTAGTSATSAPANMSSGQTATINLTSGQPAPSDVPSGQPAPTNPSTGQQAPTNPPSQPAQTNLPPAQPSSTNMSPSQQTPTTLPPEQQTPTNMPPGQQTPTNMPSGQQTPTNMPTGQQMPTNMPPGQQAPTNMPTVQQTPTNMPPSQQAPTNMPPGQQTPTNITPGQQMPTNVPPGQQTPTNMPTGQQTPTNIPSGQQTHTNMPQGQFGPTNMPPGQSGPPNLPLGQPGPPNMPPGQMMPPYNMGMGMPGQPGMYYGAGPYGGYPYNQAMPPPHPHGGWGPYGGHPHRFAPGMPPYGQGGPVQQQQQPSQPPNMPPSSTPPIASPGATPPHVPAAARTSRTPSTESQPGSATPQSKPTAEPHARTPASSSPSSSSQNQPPQSSTTSPASSSPSITPQSQQSQPAVSSSAPPQSAPDSQRTTEQTSAGETAMSSSNSAQAVQTPPSSNATSQPPVSTSLSSTATQPQPPPVPVSPLPHPHQQPPPHHQVPPPGFQQWAGPPPNMPPYPQHPQYQQHSWMGMDPYRGPHPGMNPNFQQGYYPGPPQAFGAHYPYPPPTAQQGAPPPVSRPQDMPAVSQPHDGQSSTQQLSGQDSKVEAPKSKRAKTQKKNTAKDEDGNGGVSTPAGKSKGGSSARGRGGGRGGFMIDNLLHQSKEGGPEDRGADNSGDIANDIASYVATDEYFKQKTSS